MDFVPEVKKNKNHCALYSGPIYFHLLNDYISLKDERLKWAGESNESYICFEPRRQARNRVEGVTAHAQSKLPI